MRILLTGAAGFIGFHLARRLLGRGDSVVGVDNLNGYYDVKLKEARLGRLRALERFEFVHADIADRAAMEAVFAGVDSRLRGNDGTSRFDAIVNLAAQAGVRHSLEDPYAYVQSNIVGFLHILEGARRHGTGHLVFASTSSVYGLGT